jgi:hypothetical protein
MEVIIERCCGLDVHKRSVVACIITSESQVTRTFGTMTQNVLDLSDWLMEGRVTHVAIESTGSYGNPSTICRKDWI